ncbi:glycoside hydrolase family 108 protein [Paracoccus sp. DMF-8]|uniref:glycoside hydrolase family 108 protein n=1 Tax=Paracoccus sp. DMF-8 TaxID=3019445 RepID=UPI0023E3A866|nr:glycoside hydrolase family 108 protein [Paracoccus sp. DMF-8]MDF3607570.1 glycoside hydrolase family 108 protein [Paracoccus sp. DMF-8]
MKDNFDACLAKVLAHEGGYINHPQDPGGETNYGISKRSYPNEDIRGMTRARAAQIYRRDYWDAVRGDDLPAGLDLVAFDAAVNSGPGRGAKWLQQAVGASADGKVGPATLAAAKASDAKTAINRACDYRMAFLRGLGTWPTFGKGWSRRVEDVRATALAMATTAPATTTTGGGFLASLLSAIRKILKG